MNEKESFVYVTIPELTAVFEFTVAGVRYINLCAVMPETTRLLKNLTA